MAVVKRKERGKQFGTDARCSPTCRAYSTVRDGYLSRFLFITLILIPIAGAIAGNDDLSTGATSSQAAPPDYPSDPIAKAKLLVQDKNADGIALAGGVADLRSIKKEDGESRYNEAQQLIKELNDKHDKIAHDVSGTSPKQQVTCAHKGRVSIGMTEEEVKKCGWGKPSHRNITQSSFGRHV